jgi:hypothetical protein
MRPPTRPFLPFVLSLLSACGSKTTSSEAPDGGVLILPPSPVMGDTEAFSRLTNTIPVSITVAGATGWAFIDTGDPWALLDPATYPGVASISANGGTLASLLIAGQDATNSFVIPTADGDLMGDSSFSLSANIGCSVVCAYAPAFNYRDVTLTLGATSPPAGLEAAVSVPFTFEGGGTVDGVAVPKSRIVVPVEVEGKGYSMIVDTGASVVTLSASAYAVLTADGRAQIQGGMAETVSGSSSASITRAASITLGGVEVTGVVVSHDSSFDANLASVGTDVGHTIDGSLGGTFLREFYVTVDYATQTLTFARYTDTSFALDAGEHIGIDLAIDQLGRYVVGSTTGMASTLNISDGDVIASIDGQDLVSLTSLEVGTLIFGEAGTSKQVTFGASARLTGMTIAVPVEETLPLPGNSGG